MFLESRGWRWGREGQPCPRIPVGRVVGAGAASCCGVAFPGLGGGARQLAEGRHAECWGTSPRRRTVHHGSENAPQSQGHCCHGPQRWGVAGVTEVGGGRVQFGHGSGACSPAWTDPHSRAATRRGRGDLCGLAGGMEEAREEASGVVVPSRSTDETQGASPPFLSSVVRPAREYQTWSRSRAWGGCP